jgi:hypothetical protein
MLPGLGNERRDFAALGIIRAGFEGVPQGAKILRVSGVRRPPPQPVHHRGEATLFFHKFRERFPAYLAQKKMPKENAAKINSRILDPGNEIFIKHRRIMAHPRSAELFGFLLKKILHELRTSLPGPI